ncbi:GIY-YIG nuclease family protein [Saccharobesus litoralis]|uniref:GIY-YIG nuclease family protein n=1 Tax=Saccharobesus litoralis TaxID=2172099 RepID=A0A2S0VS69_9ALTE|nr:GIY-YIG nuclease family protein [Saccharobesus litoralis]AWB67049.1 GIY-YIG nuclease family protein [Saccharobesus litoralis]
MNISLARLDAREKWSVYLILASDTSLYCGITNDVERRFKQHQTGKGAKYFRGRQPVKVAWQLNNLTHRQAAAIEPKIKKLSRKRKCQLVNQQSNYSELEQILATK